VRKIDATYSSISKVLSLTTVVSQGHWLPPSTSKEAATWNKNINPQQGSKKKEDRFCSI
jgi:hypothetical protein